MKILILILLSNVCLAGYMKKSIALDCSIQERPFYKSKELCGSDCISVPFGYNCETFVEADEMVDDTSKPIFDKIYNSETDSCLDISDCDSKFEAMSCPDSDYEKIKNYDLLQVYCVKITGYEKIASGRKILKEDPAKKASYLSALAQKNAEKAAIKQRIEDMELGKVIYAMIQISNNQKGLNKAQKRQLRGDFELIKNDLDDGNICDVKTDVLALSPNGTTILQSDLDMIVAKIDSERSCP